jgi:hypothetical protein
VTGSHDGFSARRTILIILALILLTLMIFPSFLGWPHFGHDNGIVSFSDKASPPSKNPVLASAFLQTNSSGLLELGYGPGSLTPISEAIPVYTVNDELWLESNYNSPIGIELKEPTGQVLANNPSISRGTVEDYFNFNSTIPSSNLTLLISGSQPTNSTIQFVNLSNDTIGSVSPNYSLSKDALFGSIGSLNLGDKFDIQECLTNASSSSKAQVPVPTVFGTGSLAIDENPGASTAQIFTQKALIGGPFTFSYELYANYTYALPSGHGYMNSEVEVARSNSVLVQGQGQTLNVTVSNLASLRDGRYLLRAFFENGNAGQISDTTLLLTSPTSTSWFWLGSCSKLNSAGPPSISFEQNLTGPVSEWPRFLYLMYQVVPGIDDFANISLNLNLNRIIFVLNPNQITLPADIQISQDPTTSSNKAIQSVDIGNDGSVYIITNGLYPISATFDLLFAGKPFATESVVLQSSNNDVLKNVSLGELAISATRGGQRIFNATVTISDNNLNASVLEHTDSNGNVDLFVPPGNYTITVKSGDQVMTSFQRVSPLGKTQYDAIFPAPMDYTQDLVWVISAITVIGAIGNFWFWFAKRRIRKFLGR